MSVLDDVVVVVDGAHSLMLVLDDVVVVEVVPEDNHSCCLRVLTFAACTVFGHNHQVATTVTNCLGLVGIDAVVDDV